MKKKWRTIVAGVALTAAIAAGGTALYIGEKGTTSAYALTAWSEYDGETKTFGQSFTVPERTVTVGDKTVTADSVVIFPDGSATKEKQITLSVSGIYKIIYSAEVDGKPYADEVTFRVDDGAYFFSGGQSSASFGKYQYAERDEGLLVRLAYGESITFNTPIDVSNATRFDALVEGFATPDEKGTSDFEKLIFTFADVEDPSTYLRITVRQSSEGTGYPISYALAGGNGQPMEGWEEYWKKLHINNEWGAQFRHSFSLAFSSGWTENAPDKMKISLRFDAATCQSYASDLMIIDHDDPAYYNKLWRGFKSNKVKLTVAADMITSQTANFCLTKVMGVDLTSDKFIDNDAPVLTVDQDSETMPLAKTGVKYNVPAATAFDSISGAAEVKTSVWYNYGAANAVLISVVDGKFNVERVGDYAIVYEAQDRFGNTARKTLWVHAKSTIPAPVVTIDSNRTTDAIAGEMVKIADYTATCSSGTPSVKVTVKHDGDEEITVNNEFRPEKSGVYTVTYTVTDYVGQTKSDSYDITVTAGDKPLFIDVPTLPPLFIENCNYVLPDFYAVDYRSGAPVKVKATLKVKDATGTSVAANNVVNVTVDENFKEITLIYECEGAILERKVPVVKPWVIENGRPRLQSENYLYGELDKDGKPKGFSIAKQDDGFIITAKESNGGYLFANLLPGENCDVELRGVNGSSKFDGITVKFEDAYDSNKVLVVTLQNKGSKTNAVVNGVITELQTSFNNADKFVVGYSAGNVLVNGASVEVKTFENGEDFSGFTSGKVKLSVYFNNAQIGAQYMLASVNGHPMTSATSDRIGPKVVILSAGYGGTKSIGTTVTLPAAIAGDTLDPNIRFSVKVTDPAGKTVTSLNGVTLNGADPTKEYDIKLDVYGQYSVTYTAEDVFNQRANATKFTYALNVIDEVKPEIKFNGEFKTTVKVGEVIIIPSFTVSDNVTAAEKIRVTKYVLTPSGLLVTIPEDSNSVKAEKAGKYEFRIIATDEAGNVAMTRITVTVE